MDEDLSVPKMSIFIPLEIRKSENKGVSTTRDIEIPLPCW